MKKNILFILGLSIYLFVPHLTLAECTDLGGFTSWSLKEGNTVALYYGSTPAAQFDVQSCTVRPDSKIELIKSYVCDGDEILIDGKRCTILEITPLN